MAFDIRRSRILTRGLGDTATGAQVLTAGQNLQQLIASAPSQLQTQLKALLSRAATYGPSQTVSGAISWYAQSNVGKGTGPWTDRDLALVAGALTDAQTILSTGAAPATATNSHTVQQIRALTSQMQGLLPEVSKSLTPQANAILARTTSAPSNTVTGIMSFYATAQGSNYLDRDYALLAQAVSDMDQLIATGGPQMSLPAPAPTSAPLPPPTVTNFSSPTTPGLSSVYSAGTQFNAGSIYTPSAPLPDVGSIDFPSSAPTAGVAAPAPSSGLIDLPIIGEVTPLELGVLLVIGYFVARRLFGGRS